MKNLRTDLALETHEYFTENAQKISGVSVYNTSNKNTKITECRVLWHSFLRFRLWDWTV